MNSAFVNFSGKSNEVNMEKCFNFFQLLIAEVAPGPRPQERDGARVALPAMCLQITQPT